jgi:hypothetical protein
MTQALRNLAMEQLLQDKVDLTARLQEHLAAGNRVLAHQCVDGIIECQREYEDLAKLNV